MASSKRFVHDPGMLLAASLIKLIAEIVLMALLGKGLVALLAGAGRERNFFYQILCVMTRPFERAARFVAPRVVLDQHLPYVVFFIMLFVWIAALILKVSVCLEIGIEQCR